MEYKQFKSAIKGFKGYRDPENLIIDQIISTEERDSGGDIMIQEGMFERGEVVVLYQHGQDPVVGTRPIGKPLAFRREVINGVKCTIARMQYYDGSKLPVPDNLGRLLYDMDEKGFLPNNSIGYTVVDSKPDAGGRVVSKWGLHEFSKVNIGMNQGCITMRNLPDGKVEYKMMPTSEQKATPAAPAENILQKRFSELMQSKEIETMGNLAKCSHKIAHKAFGVLHSAFISDLKAAAEKCGEAAIEAEKIAKECLSEFAKMSLPHVSSYISAMKSLTENIEEGEDDEEKSLRECGYRIAHRALKMAHKAMVDEIRACKGKSEIDHDELAVKLLGDYAGVALQHAKDFVEKWAEYRKSKTFGGLELKSIASNIAHSCAQNNLRMISDGMVSETYGRAWDDRETDCDTIASQVSAEAAALFVPHLKTIVEKVRADNPKDIGEYQKKHFSCPVTNPAESASVKSEPVDSLPGILEEFTAEQKSASEEPKSIDFSALMSELKGELPAIINSVVTKEIRKAQGKID